MRRRRLLIPLLLVILLAICIVNIYLVKSVKYTYVYGGVVTTEAKEDYIFEQNSSNNVMLFNSVEEWHNFADKYLLDLEVEKLQYEKGPILVVYTNLSIAKTNEFFDAKMIKRNLFSYKVTLQKRGELNSLAGFDKDFNYKNIAVYQLKPQLIASKFIREVQVN